MPPIPKKLNFVSNAPVQGVTIQVAPMIDLIFQLIWFYLLVGQLVSYTDDPAVQLAGMANPLVKMESPAELVVNLRSDGVVTVQSQPTELPVLSAILSESVAKAAQAGQTLRVVVRADRRQSFARLDEVLAVCRQAGINQVVFRTLGKESP